MLHMIAAVDKARGIGKDNQLLCHLSADLKHFKNLTMGHTIIMGRKTFESLPGLLPGRPHWVLTGQRDYEETHPGITVFHDMDDMVRAVRTGEEYFIIGGASLYTEFMGRADSLYLTEIDAELPADTFSRRWTGRAGRKWQGMPMRQMNAMLIPSLLFIICVNKDLYYAFMS